MPRRAPELLNGSARSDAARCRRGRKPLSATPFKSSGAQGISGIRAAFSLDTFFWPRKRKYRGWSVREPTLKTSRRDSDTVLGNLP